MARDMSFTNNIQRKENLMAKLKVNNLRKKICENCKGNGYIRIALDNSQVHQCWVCDSEGEVYEERTDLIDDNPFSNKLH